MVNSNNKINLSDRFPSLTIALDKLLNKQEKDWGYFQVKKEKGGVFYSLYLPYKMSLKLYRDDKNLIYRGYWRKTSDPLPEAKKRQEQPDIFIKKRQRMIADPKRPRQEKKQRIYEVVYKYDPNPEINTISTLLTNMIRDRIDETVIYPEDELKPQAVVTEETS